MNVSVTAKRRIEDFSGGQFYILEPEYQESDEYLEQLLKDARLALRQRDKLSQWGISVATRLCREIPAILGHSVKRVEPKQGFVYLIHATGNLYKIGCSNNPEKRLTALATAFPFSLAMICILPTNDMFRMEKQLHFHFAEKRANREWFNLDASDVEYIKGLVS